MTCPWCGSDNIKHDNQRMAGSLSGDIELGGAKILVAAVVEYSECECGLVFQEHRQSDEWYTWFYESGTYRDTMKMYQGDIDADELDRAVGEIKFIASMGIHFKHHLDIGSSRGYFLEQTRKVFGCSVYSEELNQEYSHAKYPQPTKDIDMVTAIHVLEHVCDPLKELTRWAGLTNKYMLIEVPGLKRSTLGFSHLYYFPPELLRSKIEQLGFNIMAVDTELHTRILAERK